MDFQLSVSHALPATTNEIFLSQDAYIVGFPFGMEITVGKETADFPVPLVKKGIISALFLSSSDNVKYFLVDAYNNPGFSGGPLICLKNNNPMHPQVIGVISSYRFEWKSVIDKNGKVTDLKYQSHANLTVAHAIS